MGAERKQRRRESGLKTGTKHGGSHHEGYTPFSKWEYGPKHRKRAKVMNFAAARRIRNTLLAALNPNRQNGPVREMKDMTQKEIEEIKSRYNQP